MRLPAWSCKTQPDYLVSTRSCSVTWLHFPHVLVPFGPGFARAVLQLQSNMEAPLSMVKACFMESSAVLPCLCLTATTDAADCAMRHPSCVQPFCLSKADGRLGTCREWGGVDRIWAQHVAHSLTAELETRRRRRKKAIPLFVAILQHKTEDPDPDALVSLCSMADCSSLP